MKNIHRVKCDRCGKDCDIPRVFTDENEYNRQICHSCYEIQNKNQTEADKYSRDNVDLIVFIEGLQENLSTTGAALTALQEEYDTLELALTALQGVHDDLIAEFDAYKIAHPAE